MPSNHLDRMREKQKQLPQQKKKPKGKPWPVRVVYTLTYLHGETVLHSDVSSHPFPNQGDYIRFNGREYICQYRLFEGTEIKFNLQEIEQTPSEAPEPPTKPEP